MVPLMLCSEREAVCAMGLFFVLDVEGEVVLPDREPETGAEALQS